MSQPLRQDDPFPGPLSLVTAVERLAVADTLADIIEIVRQTARDVSGADGVTFVLRDGELCHYVEEDAVAPLWKGKRFPLTACISGWCMLNDRSAVIPDIYVDPRIPHDAYRPTFVKSLVMVPVRTTRPIAAIGSYWAQVRHFDDDEVAILEALGRSASAAIRAAQLRDTLRDSERRLSMALAAGGLGAWELDLVTGELVATPACKAVFGWRPDDPFTPNDVVRAIHPDDRAQGRRMFNASSPQSQPKQYRIMLPDGGERYIEMRGQTVLDANEAPVRVTGVVSDITERLRAKERLDRAQADLAHVQRQNEMGQMASALAHELNQPLTAAVNYMRVAEKTLPQGGAQSLAAMQKAGAQFDRATAIIKRIRGFVSKGKSARAKENMADVIAEAVELAQLDPRQRGVDLRLEIAEDLPAALVDRVEVQQVLLNLLRNAFEAMEGRDGRRVTVSARAADGLIELSISDTGPGLAPAIAARLFQPFQTTKEDGMGVGLSLCRAIVEAHGGRMWSEPGEGATFRFTLPMA